VCVCDKIMHSTKRREIQDFYMEILNGKNHRDEENPLYFAGYRYYTNCLPEFQC